MLKFAARHTCDSPEWYTPSKFVEASREVMGGIDLDPASHEEANAIVKATKFYTEEDDGLKMDWYGRVFLNPPGGLVVQFWNRLMWHVYYEKFEQAIWIGYSLEQLQTLQGVNGSSPLDFPICVPNRRISFVENEAKRELRMAKLKAEGKKSTTANSPSHANYITYIGFNVQKFAQVFSKFGQVRV